MICLYDKRDTQFVGNGICVLEPSVCTVSEVAGGSYTLYMEHPIDENGKYALITDERIIRAPVPPTHVPEIDIPYLSVLQTTAATNLYAKNPSTSRVAQFPEAIMDAKQNPSAHAWYAYSYYSRGAVVTYGGGIYTRSAGAEITQNGTPGTSGSGWTYVTTVAGSGYQTVTNYSTVLEILAANVIVYKIADFNGDFVEVRAASGNVGYVDITAVEEAQAPGSGMTIPAQDITEQLFRIYKISYEDDENLIVVEAKHISYDFQGNALYSCKLHQESPVTAISLLRGSLMEYDDRTIVSNITGKTVTQDWSYENPINALLDPDSGLVPSLGAALIRNNRSFYILDNSNPRRGIRIAYGANLLGVKWSRNTEDVITRVLPRCGDGNNGYVWLDQVWVESDISRSYAYQRTEMMDCDYEVGKEYEKADGTKITMDVATAKAQMLEDAQKRFTVDKVDAVEVELEVNFLLIGDTEEYAQYRGLQTVSMYDLIEIVTGVSGVMATAQVCEYEYDSILKRFNSIKVGDIRNLEYRIPGYRVKKGGITIDKLGQDVVSRLRSVTTINSGE